MAKIQFHFDFGAPPGTRFMLEKRLARKSGVIYEITPEDKRYADIIVHASNYHQRRVAACTLNATDPYFSHKTELREGVAPHGPAVVEAIRYFYETNEVFRMLLARRHLYGLFANWEYFARKLENYPVWGGEQWIPSDEDLLHSRMRTTGMHKFNFSLSGNHYQLIDVGGQRNERKKFFFLFGVSPLLSSYL